MTQGRIIGWHSNVMHHNSQLAHFSPPSIYSSMLYLPPLIWGVLSPFRPFHSSFPFPIYSPSLPYPLPFLWNQQSSKTWLLCAHILAFSSYYRAKVTHTQTQVLSLTCGDTAGSNEVQACFSAKEIKKTTKREWDREIRLDNVQKGHISLI